MGHEGRDGKSRQREVTSMPIHAIHISWNTSLLLAALAISFNALRPIRYRPSRVDLFAPFSSLLRRDTIERTVAPFCQPVSSSSSRFLCFRHGVFRLCHSCFLFSTISNPCFESTYFNAEFLLLCQGTRFQDSLCRLFKRSGNNFNRRAAPRFISSEKSQYRPLDFATPVAIFKHSYLIDRGMELF